MRVGREKSLYAKKSAMPGSTCERLAREGELPECNLRIHVGRACERCGSRVDHREKLVNSTCLLRSHRLLNWRGSLKKRDVMVRWLRRIACFSTNGRGVCRCVENLNGGVDEMEYLWPG
jgi:hypothetical protein